MLGKRKLEWNLTDIVKGFMKEIKRNKEHKKKPGEFKKSKIKNKNIQNNMDRLRLLNEGTLKEAELLILDFDGFKKVTVIPVSSHSEKVVYLANGGKKHRLRTAMVSCNNDCQLVTPNGSFYIKEDHILAEVVQEEMITPHVKAK